MTESKSTDKRKVSDERGAQNDHKQDDDDKQDEAQKAADIAKEQENLEKQILHSLITLLMKVKSFFFLNHLNHRLKIKISLFSKYINISITAIYILTCVYTSLFNKS